MYFSKIRASLTVLAACLCLWVEASYGEGLKIGFVSTDRVFKESRPAIEAQEKLQREFSEREREIRTTNETAKALQQKLAKEELTMSEADRRKLESELASLSRESQRLQREFREELNLRKNEEMKLVLEIANKAIFEIAEKENYDLILQDAVYRSPRLDITEKVIEALRKR